MSDEKVSRIEYDRLASELKLAQRRLFRAGVTKPYGEDAAEYYYDQYCEMKKERDALICSFCKNEGVHMCPDVAQPIEISCTKIGCVYGELNRLRKLVKERNLGASEEKP